MAYEEVLKTAASLISSCADPIRLRDIRSELLGKKSFVSLEAAKLGQATPEERKELGAKINSLKQKITDLLEAKQKELEGAELENKLRTEKVDATIPGRRKKRGSLHPVTKATEELVSIFSSLGFSLRDGPNIEEDFYNFTALNIDENHPARQMHDTFYLKNGKLLRTHTSTVQIRTMEKEKPPLRIIAPGRVYRCDSDATHTPMFHQMEGLAVDRGINMGHLKYILTESIYLFFERRDIEIRFRPSFFPFTEPSAEVDIKLSAGSSWLEVLGSGMVHREVLGKVDIDPEKYSGLAFGFGIDRFAMLKYGIKDLRNLFEGDARLFSSMGFPPFGL